MSDRRILATRDGQAVPLFGTAFKGPLSPSPTLLVETVQVPRLDLASHTIPGQVLTLFLQGGTILHNETGGPTSRIAVPAKSLAFSMRDREEQLHWETPAKFLSLCIDDAVLARASEAMCRGGRFELMPSPQVRDEQLAALLLSLHHESSHGYLAGRLYVDAIEQALAACLLSRHNALGARRQAAPTALPAATAQRLLDYMHAHITKQLTLAELAGLTAYSPSHFSRLFKATFGMPAHHYLMHLRVEKAKQLLRSTRPYSMLDIALLAGFASAPHFSRIFLRFAGLTPSAFRREFR